MVIWCRTYGKGPFSSKRGNPLPPHGLLFLINSKGSFICTIPQTLCYTRLEREIAQWVHPMKDRSDDLSHHERMLLPRELHLAPQYTKWQKQQQKLFGIVDWMKEMIYLTMHSAHFIYSYIMWLCSTHITSEENISRATVGLLNSKLTT